MNIHILVRELNKVKDILKDVYDVDFSFGFNEGVVYTTECLNILARKDSNYLSLTFTVKDLLYLNCSEREYCNNLILHILRQFGISEEKQDNKEEVYKMVVQRMEYALKDTGISIEFGISRNGYDIDIIVKAFPNKVVHQEKYIRRNYIKAIPFEQFIKMDDQETDKIIDDILETFYGA